MTTPSITLYPDTLPAKGQANDAFDVNVNSFLNWLTLTNGPELQGLVTYTNDVANTVLATALAGDLPALTGKAGNYIRANAAEDGGEFRTTGQVASDIGFGTTGTPTLTDLTLSGGIFLGGLSTSNKLDDYEEGAWTPDVSGVSLTTALGNYTKVGNLVRASFNIAASATTASGGFRMSGIPFTPANATGALPGRSAGYLTFCAQGTYQYQLFFQDGVTAVEFRRDKTAAIDSITSVTGSGNIYFGTLIYYTA